MKHYQITPSYKKSTIEYNVWEKKLEDGTLIRATLEIGWRSGTFVVHVPETNEEIDEWLENRGMSIDDYDGDYDLVKPQLCPTTEDDLIEFDDYDTDMLDTWDGNWEEWSVAIFGENKDEYDPDEIQEEIEEAYSEDWSEGLENLGFSEEDCYYEMHCNPIIVECDEDGSVHEEETEAEA